MDFHLTLTSAKFNPLGPRTSSSMNSLSDQSALFLGIELKSIPSRVGKKFAPLQIAPLPIIYIWPHSWFLLDSHFPSSLCVCSAVITGSFVSPGGSIFLPLKILTAWFRSSLLSPGDTFLSCNLSHLSSLHFGNWFISTLPFTFHVLSFSFNIWQCLNNLNPALSSTGKSAHHPSTIPRNLGLIWLRDASRNKILC